MQSMKTINAQQIDNKQVDQKKLAIQHATWRVMNAVLSGDYIEESIAEEELKRLENN